MAPRSHRGRTLGAALVALVAGVALAACGSSLAVGRFETGPGPLAERAQPGSPLDLGLVRVYLPRWIALPTWSVGFTCGARQVVVSLRPPSAACLAAGKPQLWVVPSTASGLTRRRTIGAGTEILIPPLHVALYGIGHIGEALAEGAKPSALAWLLRSSLHERTPSSWRRTTLGPVSIAVPPGIRIVRLDPHKPAGIGSCDGQLFPSPLVSVGSGNGQPFVTSCFALTSSTLEQAYATPGDGAWLHRPVKRPPGERWPTRYPFDYGAWLGLGHHPHLLVAHRVVDGKAITLHYAPAPVGDNVVEVTFVAHGAPYVLDLGLGRDPTLAETMLASLRVR